VISDIVVMASVVFALVFVAAWVVSPALRAWIERPKHRFHEAVTEYDLAQQRSHHAPEIPHRD
jgi:hypothetical protein